MSQEVVSYYEDFQEIEKKIWDLLTNAVTDRSSEFRTPVFICGNDKDLDGRVVVLRKTDQENNLIQYHSDIRSSKIEKIKLLGPSGSGQLTKMVNQICIAGLVQGLSEAINFGMNAGLNMHEVIEVISKGAAQSWQMENRHKTMIDNKFDYGFAVDWMRKDLKIAMDEAKKNNSPLPITKIIDEYYAEVQKMGGQRWDTSSLIKRFRK